VTGQETFEFAAAVAGVSIGLAAILMLSAFAVVGTWRLFRHASDASQGATRAVVAIEELARALAGQPAAPAQTADEDQLADVRRQAETLMNQQSILQEMARNLLDAAADGGGPPPGAIDDLESTVGRLDATVGQMAASMANLVQLLERQQEQR
jgi:hypothetical protein